LACASGKITLGRRLLRNYANFNHGWYPVYWGLTNKNLGGTRS
jgi:hypothetical protein